MTLARDAAALRARRWATTATSKATPESDSLSRASGFPDSYGVDTFWQLSVANGMFEELFASIVELQESGAFLPWNAAQQYRHVAYVVGSDRIPYVSVRDSVNKDPVADSGNVDWMPLFGASNLQAATAATVEAGAESNQFISPVRLLGGLFKDNVASRWHALTNRFGLVKRATAADVTARSGDGYVAAGDLPSSSTPADATTTTKGISRRATESEADDGTAQEPHMTPALVTRLINALNISGYAQLAGATFTGALRGLTRSAGDDSTHMATTAFVQQELGGIVGETIYFNAAGLALSVTGTEVDFTGSIDLDDYDQIKFFGGLAVSPQQAGETHWLEVESIPTTGNVSISMNNGQNAGNILSISRSASGLTIDVGSNSGVTINRIIGRTIPDA